MGTKEEVFMKKRVLALLPVALSFAILAGSASVASAANVNQETVLTGKVVSAVSVGTSVQEGDTLVTVQTITGPMVAARSNVDGVVTQVNVKANDSIQRGQVVAVVDGK